MYLKTLKIDVNGTIYNITGTSGINTDYVKHMLQNSETLKRKEFSDIGLKDLFNKYNAKFV